MKPDIKTLSLEDKLHLLIGWSHWNTNDLGGKLPAISMNDGPHGWRQRDPKTGYTPPAHAYPTLSLLADSWDPETVKKVAAAIADEFIEHDVDMLLAPGVNIKRNPLCGRNFEYFSEDPLLAGTMGKAYIQGAEEKGVATSLKHYVANNQEYYRRMQSSEVDERTLHEIYLRPFEICLEGKPATVMCSYNPVNGIYTSENKYLLDDVLRQKFGFQGPIVSDWGAVHDRAKCLKATLDLQMPYKDGAFENLKQAYDDGFITDAEIDASVQRILDLIALAMERRTWRKRELTDEQRFTVAESAAADSFVLLKNEGQLLPLKKGMTLTVAGNMAELPAIGGGGSSAVVPMMPPISLAEELKNSGHFADVTIFGPLAKQAVATNVFERQCSHDLRTTSNIKANLSHESDVAIVCVGNSLLVEKEAIDRETLRLRKIEEDLIRNMAKYHEKVVVVLYAGGVIDVSPWIDCVDAVILAGFGGEAVNRAMAKTLTGENVPSGKLAETWPCALEDTYCKDDFGDGFVNYYGDYIMVGYRYYDDRQLPVRFPFGYGLSYAQFRYEDLTVEQTGDTDFTVSFSVTNLSDVDAKEISQLYVSDPICSVLRPVKELRAFRKTLVPAGQTVRVSMKLDRRAFAFYNVNLRDWYVENGRYDILVGGSSADLPLRARVDICLPGYTQYSINHR